MIEKLDIIKDSENCVDAFGYMHNVALHKAISKINELVDAVNELLAVQKQYETIYNEDIVPMLTPKNEEPEYKNRNVKQAEKWMYCLCRFWNDGCDSYYGELVNIDTKVSSDAPFERDTGDWYQCCEPVKPDDDIIYKGE